MSGKIDYINLDSGFGATSLFMKFSKSGLNHLSDWISFHCSLKVPYLKSNLNQEEIAQELHVDQSTVSRDLQYIKNQSKIKIELYLR